VSGERAAPSSDDSPTARLLPSLAAAAAGTPGNPVSLAVWPRPDTVARMVRHDGRFNGYRPAQLGELLARAEAAGMRFAREPVTMFVEESGAMHSEICASSVSPRPVYPRDLVHEPLHPWCSCMGWAGTLFASRFSHAIRLWELVESPPMAVGSWPELATMVVSLRTLFGFRGSSTQDPALAELEAVARSAAASSVYECAATLDRWELQRLLAVPAAAFQVQVGDAVLLSRWASQRSLSGAERAERALPCYDDFDRELARQVSADGGLVLVDLGSAEFVVGADDEFALVGAPTELVLVVAAGLASTVGGRLFARMHPLAAAGLVKTLHLPVGSAASSDVVSEDSLELLSGLSRMLADAPSLDERIELAEAL
jgi:hypothetical protein